MRMNDNFPPGYHSFEADNDWDDEINIPEPIDEDDDSGDYRDDDIEDDLLI
jgi:hypothetical protein